MRRIRGKHTKSVVVTGANSGIGLATSLVLAEAGYDVIGTVRDDHKGATLVETAAEQGLDLRYVRCDVADAQQTELAFAEIDKLTDGGPWAVVNNAGYAQSGAIEDVSDELARAQLEVNLLAPARIARLVLPGMRERGSGRIVNVSSIAGRVSVPMAGWYAASKHALEALSDALRTEVAPFGVTVILIEPGSFGTGIWAEGASRLPTVQNEAYAGAYARAGALTSASGRMPDPVWVARTIRLALANPMPLSRYLVGVDAFGALIGDALAPTVVGDYVKGVLSGLRAKPGLPGIPGLGSRD